MTDAHTEAHHPHAQQQERINGRKHPIMTAYVNYMRLLIEAGLTQLGVPLRDDKGAMSTEAAVLTAVLVAIAVAAGAILIAKMVSNAEAIPDNVAPPTPTP